MDLLVRAISLGSIRNELVRSLLAHIDETESELVEMRKMTGNIGQGPIYITQSVYDDLLNRIFTVMNS